MQLKKGRLMPTDIVLYCPKLFFSRDHSLVRKAIKGLFYKPSNQFRIFQNGCQVEVSKTPVHEDELATLLADAIVSSDAIQKYIELQHELLANLDFNAIETCIYNGSIATAGQYREDLLALSKGGFGQFHITCVC